VRGYPVAVPKDASVLLEVDGFEVAISNPGKLFFEQAGITKIDLVNYYLAVAPGALRGVMDRPMALKRFVNGAAGEAFFQKRLVEAELLQPAGAATDASIDLFLDTRQGRNVRRRSKLSDPVDRLGHALLHPGGFDLGQELRPLRHLPLERELVLLDGPARRGGAASSALM